jgi:hypothetical protein
LGMTMWFLAVMSSSLWSACTFKLFVISELRNYVFHLSEYLYFSTMFVNLESESVICLICMDQQCFLTKLIKFNLSTYHNRHTVSLLQWLDSGSLTA